MKTELCLTKNAGILFTFILGKTEESGLGMQK